MTGSATALPRGIVAFVFTDIEGSTRLVHRLGEAYQPLLDLHRDIIRRACTAAGGHTVSADGDSTFSAFGDAGAAVAACVEAQRALDGADWPEGAEPRVRMGVHSGLASPVDGDYAALAVHQATRVMAAAHGGQILVSSTAADGVSIQAGAGLRPLGRYRLRDFESPVRLYQVVAPGLEPEFPAVRAVPADSHNIVPDPRPMVGREKARVEIADAVAAGRVLTLIGPGGVGKSRLAGAVGVDLADRWEDGVWRVELAGLDEGSLVPGAVAEAVGAPAQAGVDRADDVIRHLETRRLLLVLDDCEHVAAACRGLVDRLRVRCDGVAVLATSREPLRLANERLWPVEPLELPPEPATSALDVLDAPAGRVFWERAGAVRPGFTVDDSNAEEVARLCRRLDGLPLLIELAAAHVSALSVREILDGVEQSVRMLTSPDIEISERHRTATGLLDWSHRLLEPPEQEALRRLSVFGGSFSKEGGAAAVGPSAGDPIEVFHTIRALVDRSLLSADVSANGTRYRLLGTVRDYGRDLLESHGETQDVADRLSGWYLDRVGPWLPADRVWVGEVGVELDNLRSVIRLMGGGNQRLGQQLACSIGWYHDATSNYQEGVEELERLARNLSSPSPERVSLLATLAILGLRTGDVDRARTALAEAEELRDGQGVPEWDDVAVERARGEITRRTGDLAGAVAIATDALSRPLSARGRGRMFNLLGTTAAALGDFETSTDALRQELEVWQELGHEGWTASAHGNLAEVALRSGDMAAAARHQRACLELAVSSGSAAMVGFSMIVAARVAGERGDLDTAARLHARAEALLSEISLVLYPDDRRESDALVDRVRAGLGASAFEAARASGVDLDLADAVALAEAVLAGPPGGPE